MDGLGDTKVTSILDSGSGTSLVSLNVVNKFKLGKYRTKLPVAFYGITGHSEATRDIAIVNLSIAGGDAIAIPAYVVDSLPCNADLLIGMDQIGKNFSIFIPFINNNKDYSYGQKFGRPLYKFQIFNNSVCTCSEEAIFSLMITLVGVSHYPNFHQKIIKC